MGATPMAGYTGKVQNLVLRDTSAGRQSSFIIELTQQADLSKAYAMKDQDARGWYVYRTLKRTAEKTQGPLKAMLDAQGVSYKSFWVANEIVVHQGSRALVDNLAGRADVKVIEANDASNWLESTSGVELDSLAILKADRPNTVEPGPVQVHAPNLWSLGFTGTGIVVGNQDTGMRWTHNAIKPHYRGWDGANADHNYNWHDSIHGPIGGQGQNPVVTHPGPVRRPQPWDAHDRARRRRRRGRQPDRRRPRREVDRLPQHGPGRRPARDLHGVLPVVHRSDRPGRPERRSHQTART